MLGKRKILISRVTTLINSNVQLKKKSQYIKKQEEKKEKGERKAKPKTSSDCSCHSPDGEPTSQRLLTQLCLEDAQRTNRRHGKCHECVNKMEIPIKENLKRNEKNSKLKSTITDMKILLGGFRGRFEKAEENQ